MHKNNRPTVSNYRILSTMLMIYWRVKKQERYLKNYLPNLLGAVVPDYQQSFSDKDIKRITKYWQLALNLVCDNIYKLTGRQLSEEENKRIILLSVFGPLFDDLFDDNILNYEQITSLVSNPETYVAQNKTDRLAAAIYLELLRRMPRQQQFIEHLQTVAHWQQESLKQLNSNISEAALQEITYKKSYFAVLIFCAVLDHYPDQKMLEILYPAAGLMQLTNDAFDVWKDVHKGVYTLPNLYRNFEQLQQLFLNETSTINQRIWQLPYSVKAKQTFAIIIHSLHAMGWMSLGQLRQVTAGVPSFEGLKQLSRKELICDMDSFQQQLKWLRHIRHFTNYFDGEKKK
ncbi:MULTISPECIES: class 1 isoprenoid biosynthesis enzyme [Niastella]|uniref:Class 1 isoprenoid biosynthesis enzyme n=1 Tax=Niastella soli TaxID=2821487 RepID=A0ABS3YP02_9BACT|nr:class 1 isoprenoid biosynthesis enzyme [Niastella soli]MBO9199558.1 class 1 isoprenoid biosynthesis enzyme [Niastella soli]